MGLLTDGLLMAASLFAGGYCWVLSRRVSDLKSLDKGLGGSIVTLTRQIELARKTLEEAQSSAGENRDELEQLVKRANIATSQLKLAVAAARDLDVPLAPPQRTREIPRDAGRAMTGEPDTREEVTAAPPPGRPAETAQPATTARDETGERSVPIPSLRSNEILAPRGDPAPRSVLKSPPPASPARAPDTPAILSETEAASASDWSPARSGRAAGEAAEIPKPASLPPLASPLRDRKEPIESASESDLIEALSLLAAGGSR